MYDVNLNHVIRILEAAHRPVTRNEYGAATIAGFSVAEGIDGKARITHTAPPPDLLNPDRASEGELARARQANTLAYAQTLSGNGWTVQHRRPDSRYPYLLAYR